MANIKARFKGNPFPMKMLMGRRSHF